MFHGARRYPYAASSNVPSNLDGDKSALTYAHRPLGIAAEVMLSLLYDHPNFVFKAGVIVPNISSVNMGLS